MKNLSFLACLVLSLNCTPRTELVSTPNVNLAENEKNSFGMRLDYVAVENAREPEKKASKAVALVRTIDGSHGTGFFISEDGLFLTNHHIISKYRCSKKRCKGVQIIRDFSALGDFEVFNSVEAITYDEDLDFMLLKVKLPQNRRVPFLELSDERVTYKGFGNRMLYIVGHPFMAPAKVTAARLLYTDASDLKLSSICLSGSSGSPLIDPKTDKVIGLYYAGQWDKAAVQKDGFTVHIGEAVGIQKIAAVIRSKYEPAAFAEPTQGVRFSEKLEYFFGNEFSTSEESAGLDRLLQFLRLANDPARLLISHASDLVAADLFRGNIGYKVENFSSLDQVLLQDIPDSEAYLGLRTHWGLVTQQECLAKQDSEKDRGTAWLLQVSKVCLSSEVPQGQSVVKELLALLTNPKWKKFPYSFNRAKKTIYWSLAVASQDKLEELKPDATKILDIIMSESTAVENILYSEGLKTLLIRNSNLLGLGSFKDTL